MVVFEKLKIQGEYWEQRVVQTAQKKGFQAEKLDYTQHLEDVFLTKNRKSFLLEIKSHFNKNYLPTFFAEICQNTTIEKPQLTSYLSVKSKADYIVQIDIITSEAFFFDAKMFRAFIKKNKARGKIAQNQSTKPFGLLIEWENKDAGFLGKWEL